MELIGPSSTQPGETGESDEKSEVNLSRDENLLRVLDRLVLYLRVVHSLDYYSGGDYPYEDEMPNRCGIIHVRGIPPEKATQAEGKVPSFYFSSALFSLPVPPPLLSPIFPHPPPVPPFSVPHPPPVTSFSFPHPPLVPLFSFLCQPHPLFLPPFSR